MNVRVISLPSDEFVVWVPKKGGYLLNHPTHVAQEIKKAWVMNGEQLRKVISRRKLVPMGLGHGARG